MSLARQHSRISSLISKFESNAAQVQKQDTLSSPRKVGSFVKTKSVCDSPSDIKTPTTETQTETETQTQFVQSTENTVTATQRETAVESQEQNVNSSEQPGKENEVDSTPTKEETTVISQTADESIQTALTSDATTTSPLTPEVEIVYRNPYPESATIQVKGSWDSWASPSLLEKTSEYPSVKLTLQPGQYQFKFIVTTQGEVAEWLTDNNYQIVDDGCGNVNNFVQVQ